EDGDVRRHQGAQLDQRLPPVGPVLLPEGGVRLVAAGVRRGPLYDPGAVAQRPRRPAGYARWVGVEADAEERVARPHRRAEAVKEAGHPSIMLNRPCRTRRPVPFGLGRGLLAAPVGHLAVGAELA